MRTVADEMTELVVVECFTTIQDASARMLDAGAAAAVVVDGGVVSGVLTAQHVAQALAEGRDATSTPVDLICDPAPMLARPDEPLVEVHQRMRAEQHELAVAVRAGRKPVGLLADRS